MFIYKLFYRYKYKLLKHRYRAPSSVQDDTYNMSLMSNYSTVQPATFTTFTRYYCNKLVCLTLLYLTSVFLQIFK